MTALPDNYAIIDFETWNPSGNGPGEVGAWRYSVEPGTEVICMGWATEEDTGLWLPGQPSPEWMNDPTRQLVAWNSFFEWAIWTNVLHWGDDGTFHRWHDAAAWSAAMNLPMGLEGAGAALGVEDAYAKSARGKYLIRKLCVPQKDGSRCRDPDLLMELYDYCEQDCTALKWIADRLNPLSDQERRVWLMDQRINRRGIRMDMPAARALEKAREHHSAVLDAECAGLTGGTVPSMRSLKKAGQFIETDSGFSMPSFSKLDVQETLEAHGDELTPTSRRLLEIRQFVGQTASAKLAGLPGLVDPRDDRIRCCMVYHVGGTGRWGGKLFQPQNMMRPAIDDAEWCIEFLKGGGRPSDMDLYWDDPMAAIGSSIRGLIVPAPGFKLMAVDFSSIEARFLAWLARQEDKLDVFRTHGKVYEHTASQMFGIPVEEITKDGEERFHGKTTELACGYQGGAPALQKQARKMGREYTDGEAAQKRDMWREANPRIVDEWENAQNAIVEAVRDPGQVTTFAHGRIRMVRSGAWLAMRLPSGKLIWFPFPALGVDKYDNDSVSAMGIDPLTKRWDRRDLYGGRAVAFATQGTARERLVHTMLRLDERDWRIVLTIHDEIISEEPIDNRTLQEYTAEFLINPSWAEDVPVAADGDEGDRYAKR